MRALFASGWNSEAPLTEDDNSAYSATSYQAAAPMLVQSPLGTGLNFRLPGGPSAQAVTGFSNDQPTTTISIGLDLNGVFPSQGGSGSDGVTLATIRMFGGNFYPGEQGANAVYANGALLSIADNDTLYQVIGTKFGGDGITTFAVPNLDGAVMISTGQGAGLSNYVIGQTVGADGTTLLHTNMPAGFGGSAAPFDNHQPSLAINYCIRVFGPVDAGTNWDIGDIIAFAGDFVPGGYLPCDGRVLNIAGNSALHGVLGNNYGGDGVTTFALPDLRGRVPIGVSSTVSLGEKVGAETLALAQSNLPASAGGSGVALDQEQPGLGLHYIICTNGVFPSRTDGWTFDQGNVGEIMLFAGTTIPTGWHECDGTLVNISANTALFSILGTFYGGDGKATFALPDLRGQVVTGVGVHNVGETYGSDLLTLLASDIYNAVPAFTGLQTATTTEQVHATIEGTAAITDANLAGIGNYAGANLIVVRQGGASAQDDFGFDTTGAAFTVSGANLQSGGLTFATFTLVNGTLTINFSGTGTAATQALVNDVLRHITYANLSDVPPASVTLNITINDGNSGGGQGDGGTGQTTQSVTVNITAVDDGNLAYSDALAVQANATLPLADLFADNGSGPDGDPDGGPAPGAFAITAVNGNAAAVDVTGFALPSGALVTVGSNGQLTYDPNHAFDDLAAPGSGASNTSRTDTFTYTITGGATATVAVTVTGVDNANTVYIGSAGNDTITGGNADHLFDLSDGGNDHVTGGSGNDGFKFEGTFNFNDTVDGGGGTNDQIGLEGDYSGGLTLSGTYIHNIEVIAMLPGFDYVFSTTDSLVASGATFTFWSITMAATNHVSIDGHLESDGLFNFFLGQGDDTAIGGAQNDLFYGEGGQDTLKGNGGADTFSYLGVSDSTSTTFDIIQDFVQGVDVFNLPVTVTGVDAMIVAGALSSGASFDVTLAAATASLGIGHAVVFTPTIGDFNGRTFLVVDSNGSQGYQAGADYVFEVTNGTNLASLSSADFI